MFYVQDDSEFGMLLTYINMIMDFIMLLYIYMMYFIVSTICFILFYFLQRNVLSAGIHMRHVPAVHVKAKHSSRCSGTGAASREQSCGSWEPTLGPPISPIPQTKCVSYCFKGCVPGSLLSGRLPFSSHPCQSPLSQLVLRLRVICFYRWCIYIEWFAYLCAWVYTCTHACMHAPQHASWDQRTTFRSWFSVSSGHSLGDEILSLLSSYQHKQWIFWS